MYDITSPENDDEAAKLGNLIRHWINQGRPKPGGEKKQESYLQKEETDTKHKQDKEEEKSKKKRGVFGFFKK